VTTEVTTVGGGTTAAARRVRLGVALSSTGLEVLLPLLGLVVLQQIWFGTPLGVLINGALVGSRIALIAVGIALIYRANRIVNFAQGDLGALPATLSVMLVVSWGWSYWFGLVAGLLAAVVLGVLVETLLIRRFFTAPRLVLTVATIGIAQLLTGAALWLPRLFDDTNFGTKLPQPFHHSVEIGGTVFNANDIVTMIVAPLAMLALALFLQRSVVGIAIVGAAERADRASTLGIPVRRLHTVVWVVASVLAFLAMYLRAGTVGLPIGQVLSPIFLVQALAAAVFGRFTNFPTIAGAAVAVGIIDQSMVFQRYEDGQIAAVLFLIVLLGMLVTRRNGTSRVDADASSWLASREVRPYPRELVWLPEVILARVALWLVVGLFVATLPLWLSTSRLHLATLIVLSGIVAASLVVLSGWAGQVSLGHIAFVGVGAATGGYLSQRGWDLALTVLAAGLVGAVAAVVVGYPALRRKGLTLAVSTLAFSLMAWSYLFDRTIFDWLPKRTIAEPTLFGSIAVDSETKLFVVSLAALGLALIMVVGLRRSRTGRVLIAIRENERAAASFGVHTIRTTLAAFALSGFLASFAGALIVHLNGGFSAEPYTPEHSLELFSMVVIGGLGSLPGALLGATYVQGADFFLPQQWSFLASGVGLLLVLLAFPGGLGGVLADLRDAGLRWVAKRRNLIVPSLVADVRVDDEPGPLVLADPEPETGAEAEPEPVVAAEVAR
jgi:branched-chain amino acid transport system permease protein